VRALLLAVAAVAATALAAPADGGRSPGVRLIAAGDIASCSASGDSATARLLQRLPGIIAPLGDLAYERGTDDEFRRCYAPTWGRFRARTRPAVGNHEYGTTGAAGYFRYFGRLAGPRRGYYSYDLGAWHVVVLNTNCEPAGGCGAGSPQERWLRADLAAHRTRCTVAYGHHPRYSSGPHGDDTTLAALWRALSRGGADLYLAGHDHDYERFRPFGGVRQFVVGTGGRSLYPILALRPGSQVHSTNAFGVLQLRLRASSYAWRFVAVPGSGFRDSGSARCR
jgi:hypothetical protein